ncbi:MAG: T9SS type A sorting domain-containing protein [Crocinitomicaceae bacterium]
MRKIYFLFVAIFATMAVNAQTNLDFETWSGTPLTATGWTPLGAQDSMFQASGILAISGTYSMGVKNVYKDNTMGGDSLAGSWVYQDMSVVPDSVKLNARPAMLGTDTARVMVYTWNGVNPVQVFLIEMHAGNTTPGSVYTLTYDLTSATTFDAISVDIYSSKSPNNYNSTVIVDDVQIFEPSGVGFDEQGLTAINVYPNPATTEVNFNLGNNDVDYIKVLDLSGRIVDNIVVNSSVETLSTVKYQNGVYFYQVINNNEVVKTDKFVVSK